MLDQKRCFLHVGCGTADKSRTTRLFGRDNWREVRLDIDPAVKPDITGSITDMGVLKEQYDGIYSSHNLEHLFPHEVPQALSNFFRALRPQGHLVLSCPDLQAVCKHIAEGNLLEPLYQSPAGPVAPVDILYGFRPLLAHKDSFMAHRCGFTLPVLMNEVKRAGFGSLMGLRNEKTYSLHILATKDTRDDAALKELIALHWEGVRKG